MANSVLKELQQLKELLEKPAEEVGTIQDPQDSFKTLNEAEVKELPLIGFAGGLRACAL